MIMGESIARPVQTTKTKTTKTKTTETNTTKTKTTKATKKFGAMESISIGEAEEKLKHLGDTRKEQYDIAVDCVESLMNDKNCSVRAEEKTGKRVIMEAIHLIISVNHGCNVRPEKSRPRSVYVTALNRKDTKDQFREQEEFGIFSIVATKHASLIGEIIKLLNDPTNDGLIYIHLDECDYGTGCDQSLSKLYLAEELNLPIHKNRIKYVTYSATPEELEYSNTLRCGGWDKHEFIPSKDYLGAEWYLENELVFRPETFFDGSPDFSHQGARLIEEVRETCRDGLVEEVRLRNVIVVRDTGKGNLGKIREMKSSLQDKHGCEIHIFDQSTSFAWGDPLSWASLGRTERLDDNMTNIGNDYIPVLIFISQICTRSTEICPLGHRKIAVWHDSRKLEDKKAYNTISQAIGRVKHYSQEGHPVNRIKLYCDANVLKHTVGMPGDGVVHMGSRIQTVNSKKHNMIILKGFDDGYEDVGDVPDTEWQDGDPRSEHLSIPGEWKLYQCGKYGKEDLGPQLWNSKETGGYGPAKGGVGKRGCIQYENQRSERWMYRMAIYERKTDGKNMEYIRSFETKKTSMYA
jgi:hypothetical protein